LGDIGSVAMNRRIFKEQTSDKGEIPFFKIGTFGGTPDAFISRDIFEEYKSKYPYPEIGDILISASGSIGRTVEYTGKDEYFQDSNIVWVRHEGRIDNKFLKQFYSIVKWKGLEGSTIKRLYNKNILDTTINLPSLPEQDKIGTFFDKLDNAIALHQRKLTLLKHLKQMYLQKLFPQNGENIPELRFAGFTEIWDQRKLKDLYERNTEKNNGQFDSENTISIASMKFKPEGNGAAEESINSYKVLRMGDIAFEGHTSKLYSFGRFVLNDIGDGIMSPRFTTLRPKKEMYIPFWKQYIIYEPIMKHLLVKATKLGTMMNELVLEDFFNQFLLVPSDNEQQKIGSFFKQLDDIIDLHQCKLENLTELKQALLAKMIV
ncbi:MAG: restriction endonuclease subunit S, partial [Neofamilia sp.]